MTQSQLSADWPYPIGQGASSLKRSFMREMVAVTARPDIISFAGGLPAPELFPVDTFQACLDTVMRRNGRQAMQYGPPFLPLREALSEFMAGMGVQASPDEIFITSGAQQGLAIVTRLFLDRGSPAIVESTVFTGVAQVLQSAGAELRTVRTDLTSGLDVDQVEAHLRREPRPKLMVVIPTFHNPLGVTVSAEKRARLVELSRHYRVAILEDDPYSPLRFAGEDLLPLKAIDQDGGVLYVGSFSKILGPGLRLGWLVTDHHLSKRLAVIKESMDLETSALMQRAVAEFMQSGYLVPHLQQLRAEYRRRAEAMQTALEREFPRGVSWTHPQGGMFLWAVLPEVVDTMALLRHAVEQEKVAFIPGSAFCVDGGSRNTMRLNFSNASAEVITEGICRLGRIVRAQDEK